MKYTSFEELPVWQLAIDLAVRTYEWTEAPEFNGRYSMKDQIERAAVCVANNIAEGFDGGTNPQLLPFLYIARGSVAEVRSMLCLLEKMAAFRNQEPAVRSLKEKTESISKQLGAWIQALLNSGMKGQRHVTEKVRTHDRRRSEREEFLNKLERIRRGEVSGYAAA